MKPLSLLFLIFLSSCGLVHIEIRDKSQPTRRSSPRVETKPQAEAPRKPMPETAPKERTGLKVELPVRGRLEKTERGYFIHTSCGEFFRSVSEGRVLYSGDDIKNYYWVVMVESEEGLVYVYAKGESALVKRGERVKKGQPLGKVGKYGETCGILFEVRDTEGKPLNFEPVL